MAHRTSTSKYLLHRATIQRQNILRLPILARFVGIIAMFVLMNSLVMAVDISVATVNGEDITEKEFRERMVFEQAFVLIEAQVRYSMAQQQAKAFAMDVNALLQPDQQFQQWIQELQFPEVLGERVINDMVDDLLMRQEFDARGLSIGEAEISVAQQDYFGVDLEEIALMGTPSVEVTPTISATLNPNEPPPSPTHSQQELLDDYYNSINTFSQSLQVQNVSETAIDEFWRRQALEIVLKDDVVGLLETATFANARHILVQAEAEANQILEALNAGESFADLASSRSIDTGSALRGGELGWQPLDLYVASFADTVRDAPIGELVGPFESQYGFHLVEVLAREEGAVEGSQREQLATAIFSRWLDEHRQSAEESGDISINSDWRASLPKL